MGINSKQPTQVKHPVAILVTAVVVGWIAFKFATSTSASTPAAVAAPQARQAAIQAATPIPIAQAVATPEQQVVDQMIQRYRMVVNSGTMLDLCTQAGMVKAAYLQAADQRGYANWTQQEKEICGYSSEFDQTVQYWTRTTGRVAACYHFFPKKYCKVNEDQIEWGRKALLADLLRNVSQQ